MKKLILTLFLAIGTLFTQAQVNWCDSLSYTAVPGTQLLTLVGNTSLSPNMVDSITWSWAVCDTNMCYSSVGDTAYFQMIQTTDTVKVCYDAYIYFMGATYVCTQCDSMVYDGWSNSWMLMNMGNPTSIKEPQLNTNNDGKMYDLLGREVIEAQIGQIYIRNNKKYIRVK
jgi:hypothetical protein